MKERRLLAQIRRASPIMLCLAVCLFLPLCFNNAAAQTISGKIYTFDEKGKKVPLYMARVQWINSTVGTFSNVDGTYNLPVAGTDTLILRYSFYPSDTVVVNLRKKQQDFTLKTTRQLKEVVVSKKKKPKYSRKNNPAVDLVKKVIENKDKNRVTSSDCYKSKSYKKLVMTFGRFDMNFEKNNFNRQLSFLKRYIDTIKVDSTPVIVFSFRESLSENYYRRSPAKNVEYVVAKRMQGVDEVLDEEGVGTNLDEMFPNVNFFDNDMEIMMNKFVSPLSSTLATLHYHYFITDTIFIDSVRCVELSFAPVNSRTFGFTGRMYVVDDGTYAIRRCAFNVPVDINLNFVRQLRIEQNFRKLEDTLWAIETSRVRASLSLLKLKKMRQIYVKQDTYWYDYEMGVQMPDSLAKRFADNELAYADKIKYRQNQWIRMRPLPLGAKESFIDSLPTELRRLPLYKALEKTAAIVTTGYIPTAYDRKESRFDFGPIYDFISYNPTEGVRLRVGGMTTAALHDRWFVNGYMAFGCRDLRFKYNISLIHSFMPKKHHINENPQHAVFFNYSYDIESVGRSYSYIDRDNLLMSYAGSEPDHSAQYVRRAKISYLKQWENRLSVEAALKYENNGAVGTLAYWRIDHNGNPEQIRSYNCMEFTAKIRWSPGERLYSNQSGKDNLIRMSRNAPVLQISHTIGSIDGRSWYNSTDFSAEKRFWLSAFGHIDATLKSGIVWDAAPFPKLYVPSGNRSLFLVQNTFCLMRPMEFIMDKYVSLHATYYLKGWVFNRIPYWNRLNLREVVSFNGVYGILSKKNIPNENTYGLFLLPDGCGQMGKIPYMEITAGIENIFQVLRIDYVRRLTHVEGLSGWKKNGIRLSLRISF